MGDPVLRIECVHDARCCYAMQQNGVPLVPLLRLCNDGGSDLPALDVEVRLEPDLAAPWSARVAAIAAGAVVELDDVPLQPRPEALANATERQVANLRVEVRAGDVLLAAKDHAVELLAYNEWPGAHSQQALLAAFVLPNHPALAPVLRDAAGRLAATTGSAALDGYASGDPRRPALIVQAVYEALQARGITYVHPPASFEQEGQKVRTPEQVLHERMGTCLDLAVLCAACLEQAGLHALLVVTAGHALAGAWLVDQVSDEAAPADPLPLRKRVELERIALVECTTLCRTQEQPFAAARRLGTRAVAADADFLFAVDVAMARRAGQRPLPVRTNAYTSEAVGVDAGTDAPARAPALQIASAAPPPAPVPPAPAAPERPRTAADRLQHWQRRLLDLSLRNRLLNFTVTKRSVPLQDTDPTALVAALSGAASFAVLPAVAVEGTVAGTGPAAAAATAARTDALGAFLQKEHTSRRLHGDLGQEELDRRMLEIWRQARTASEESGVNTLFLAVGFLRWYETAQSQEPRRAPLWLLPLRIERSGPAEGFALALADEEARVNETLVQKLHQDFGIDVEVEDDGDDDGPEVGTVLDAFRRAVVDVDRWEVEATACISCFSFAKYLMWVDLAERRQDLLQHAFLQHLIETPEQSFVPKDDGDWPDAARLDALDPAGLVTPLDADSSQLCAVLASAQGRSFVLEGPPGTGKSQTIANLIAQCLAQGQRVLFVAEKRAALEVVQRRLHAVGLAPFCLELHSGKGQKRSVVAQLGRALELTQQREPEQWAALAQELQATRAELNAHVEAMHRLREPGCSVFAATARVVADRALPFVEGLPVDVDAAGLGRLRELVAALAGAAAPLGELRSHPWFGVRRCDWHPGLPRELPPLLAHVLAAVEPLRQAHARVADLLQLPAVAACSGRAQLEDLAVLCEQLAGGPVPAGLLLAADFDAVLARARRLVDAGDEQARQWAGLAPRWGPALLDLDVALLCSRVLQLQGRFWLLRWWGMRAVRRQLAAVAQAAVPRTAALVADLRAAVDIAKLRQELQAAASDAAAWFGEPWRGEGSDFAALRALLDRAAAVHARCTSLCTGGDGELPALLRRCAGLARDAAPVLSAYAQAHGELAQALAALQQPLQLCFDRAFGEARQDGHLDRVAARIALFQREPGALREQCTFQQHAAAARAGGLEPLEALLEGGGCSKTLPAVFERSFAESWLQALFAQEPQLQKFAGHDHERRIARFRQLDERMIALAAELVRARLCAQLPAVRSTGAESSELGVLLRELKKQRRHLAPRQLFQRIPHLIARLSPCLLMSPMTVAQVLGRRALPFEVVVFDEASQVPVWDAVGAIGRGRSLVVVGDSRQLPPTQFFQRLDGDDGEADADDRVEELESVLDECGAAGLRRLYLRWHYRSRHEALIAFSNHHYYDNRLLTFPAAERAAGLGVHCRAVAGVYDRARSQQNRIEAEALVADLVQRLRADGDLSHGVVTFSQAQQVLVEDLLDRARQQHPEIEAHFTGTDEPVLVKNLENVQGDERDVMLFSICYGPDAQGRVHMNFGPLNLQGGERRLNVAITRARRELVVFTSLRADQIELQRTQSVGVRHLRAFLDYATRGERALAAAAGLEPVGTCETPFERAVCAALQQRGHEVHAQVGCSGYRIDLAIVDPRSSGRYLLGVECDGASYHSAATARDRDRLRQAVLERLGWRLCRVWSTDWWLDQDGELRRLDAAIAQAMQQRPPAAKVAVVPVAVAPERDGVGDGEPAANEPAPEPAPIDAAPAGPVYTPVVLEPRGDVDAFHAASHGEVVRGQISAVLAAEAPIGLELLAQRVAAAWRIGRTTERVRERVRNALPRDVVERDGVLWPAGTDPATWRGFRTSPPGAAARAAEQLPSIEIECAMAWVLLQHGSMGEDDLLRETARLFGFARLGTAVRAAMATGLEDLLRRNGALRDGATIRPA